MPEEKLDKITLALKEIGHQEVRVILKDGVIVCIPVQQVVLSDENGVKIVAIIEKAITK